ncbi:hypothetical protein P7C73_g2396, partial [Tremellales sp. Uapishka_1]
MDLDTDTSVDPALMDIDPICRIIQAAVPPVSDEEGLASDAPSPPSPADVFPVTPILDQDTAVPAPTIRTPTGDSLHQYSVDEKSLSPETLKRTLPLPTDFEAKRIHLTGYTLPETPRPPTTGDTALKGPAASTASAASADTLTPTAETTPKAIKSALPSESSDYPHPTLPQLGKEWVISEYIALLEQRHLVDISRVEPHPLHQYDEETLQKAFPVIYANPLSTAGLPSISSFLEGPIFKQFIAKKFVFDSLFGIPVLRKPNLEVKEKNTMYAMVYLLILQNVNEFLLGLGPRPRWELTREGRNIGLKYVLPIESTNSLFEESIIIEGRTLHIPSEGPNRHSFRFDPKRDGDEDIQFKEARQLVQLLTIRMLNKKARFVILTNYFLWLVIERVINCKSTVFIVSKIYNSGGERLSTSKLDLHDRQTKPITMVLGLCVLVSQPCPPCPCNDPEKPDATCPIIKPQLGPEPLKCFGNTCLKVSFGNPDFRFKGDGPQSSFKEAKPLHLENHFFGPFSVNALPPGMTQVPRLYSDVLPAPNLDQQIEIEIIDYIDSGRLWDSFSVKTSISEKILVLKITTPASCPNYDPDDARSTILNEWKIYHGELKDVQGDAVPRYYGLFGGIMKVGREKDDLDVWGSWITPYSTLEYEMWMVLMDHAGQPMVMGEMTAEDKQKVLDQYTKLHERGVFHNSANLKHWMKDDEGNIKLIDFGGSQVSTVGGRDGYGMTGEKRNIERRMARGRDSA